MEKSPPVTEVVGESEVDAVGAIPVVPSILQTLCESSGMGFAAVARVTDTKWLACAVHDGIGFGLKAGGELPLQTTLCHEVRCENREIVIDHVAEDPQYRDHDTPRLYGLQSYISIPIVLSDGSFYGTLCAIDARPNKIKGTAIVPMTRLFAQLIARHLDDQRKLFDSEEALSLSREANELREQFVAVLGHDLKNPVAALRGGVDLLRKQPQSDKARTVLAAMDEAGGRALRLIDHMLDLARGRSDGGLAIERETGKLMATTLDEVVGEMKLAHPDRDIRSSWPPDLRVDADHGRIAQLFSNLLGNAIAHGAPDQPVQIEANVEGDRFVLSVANGGEPIPETELAHLFRPYYRVRSVRRREGLGLGLFIASKIAEAHSGTLTVKSDAEGTVFTLRMPAVA